MSLFLFRLPPSLFALFVCFIFFLPLTATQRGAISHSAQRGLEELKATEQKKNRKTETGRETGELGDGRGRKRTVEGRREWSEVSRREQTRQGTVAHREMEGLGIKEDNGENEQIAMEMEREIRGMTGCKGGNYGQAENGIRKLAEKEQRECGQELAKELGSDRDAPCMHGVC